MTFHVYICKNVYIIADSVGTTVIVINRSATKCDYTKGNMSDVDDNAY